jgi:hypothetical protein
MEGQIKREFTSFFKYCSDYDNVIEGIFEKHKIRFTQPWALNDPLEFNPVIKFKHNGSNYRCFSLNGVTLPSEEFRLRQNLIEPQINAFGILSLTKIPDSFDMWSRYANGHKGFMIEFDSDFNEHSCMKSRTDETYPIREVQYVDEYTINIDELTDENGWIQQESFNEQMFYRKVSRWQDEREYRVVRPFSDLKDYIPRANKPHRDTRLHLFDFSLDCVTSVTFGASMSNENKERIMKACENTKVKFLQAIIFRDEKDAFGKMGRIELVPVSYFPQFDSMLPFSFVGDMNHIEDQKEKLKINSLSELPYWEHAKDWAKQLYEARKTKLFTKE